MKILKKCRRTLFFICYQLSPSITAQPERSSCKSKSRRDSSSGTAEGKDIKVGLEPKLETNLILIIIYERSYFLVVVPPFIGNKRHELPGHIVGQAGDISSVL